MRDSGDEPDRALAVVELPPAMVGDVDAVDPVLDASIASSMVATPFRISGTSMLRRMRSTSFHESRA